VRKSIWDYFYKSLTTQEARDAFISKCIEAYTPLRTREGAKAHHKFSYQFLVKIGDMHEYICKTALCKLLGVSRAVIDRIRDSISREERGPPKIQTGRHGKQAMKCAN